VKEVDLRFESDPQSNQTYGKGADGDKERPPITEDNGGSRGKEYPNKGSVMSVYRDSMVCH